MVKRAKRADSKAETKSQPWIVAAVERYFGLKAQGTDIRTEFIAGVTTFLTMVYIVFVNPVILGKAAMFGALIGTSTTTSYIESAAGVQAGGRTGLTAAFVGVFFLLALLFAPLAGTIPAYASAAALLYVACVMARGLAAVDWEDITEYAPAVVTAITMPLTYSIATGIGLGFITYALAKLISGKVTEASPAVLVLAVLFAIKFAVAG
jgi:xanthine/uracil/vitamin C permease (AzgA family)